MNSISVLVLSCHSTYQGSSKSRVSSGWARYPTVIFTGPASAMLSSVGAANPNPATSARMAMDAIVRFMWASLTFFSRAMLKAHATADACGGQPRAGRLGRQPLTPPSVMPLTK